MHLEGDIEQLQVHGFLLWNSQLYGHVKPVRHIFEYYLSDTVPVSLVFANWKSVHKEL